MRDQYVGDVGDFAKYGLLRHFPKQGLKLGVVWYYRPYIPCAATQTGDYAGRKGADPALYDALQYLIRNCGRYVRCVEDVECGILPKGTGFFRDELPHPSNEELRQRWLNGAMRAMQDADLVFLDPDTGLIQKSVSIHNSEGREYAHCDDVRLFLEHGKSVVLYQTIRGKSIQQRIADVAALTNIEPVTLQFGTRLFIIVLQPDHADRIKAAIQELLTGPWREYFKKVGGA